MTPSQIHEGSSQEIAAEKITQEQVQGVLQNFEGEYKQSSLPFVVQMLNGEFEDINSKKDGIEASIDYEEIKSIANMVRDRLKELQNTEEDQGLQQIAFPNNPTHQSVLEYQKLAAQYMKQEAITCIKKLESSGIKIQKVFFPEPLLWRSNMSFFGGKTAIIILDEEEERRYFDVIGMNQKGVNPFFTFLENINTHIFLSLPADLQDWFHVHTLSTDKIYEPKTYIQNINQMNDTNPYADSHLTGEGMVFEYFSENREFESEEAKSLEIAWRKEVAQEFMEELKGYIFEAIGYKKSFAQEAHTELLYSDPCDENNLGDPRFEWHLTGSMIHERDTKFRKSSDLDIEIVWAPVRAQQWLRIIECMKYKYLHQKNIAIDVYWW